MFLFFRSLRKGKCRVRSQHFSDACLYICPHIYHYRRILYFYMSSDYCLAFFSTWMTPYSISCRANLSDIELPHACYSGNVLISSSFLKESFAWLYYWLIGFSHSSDDILSYCLWIANFLLKNPLIILLWILASNESHFYLFPFKVLSLSLTFTNLIFVYVWVSVCLFWLEFIDLLVFLYPCLFSN